MPIIRAAPRSNQAAIQNTPGTLPTKVKPEPTRTMAMSNTANVCEIEARKKPATSNTVPTPIVARPPIHFMVMAGSGLAKPQDRPSSEKLNPAAL